MAPEVIKGLPFNEKADVWSIGCLLYELLTGGPLYREYHKVKAVFRIASRGAPAIPERIANSLSSDCKEFLQLCLRSNPQDRASCSVCAALASTD
jgi:serine/threonine protein kinase